MNLPKRKQKLARTDNVGYNTNQILNGFLNCCIFVHLTNRNPPFLRVPPLLLFHLCRLLVMQVVQIVLWIVDSSCTRHMTGNLKLLINFVSKFIGTVRFGNDQYALIMGYGDYVNGNIEISRVYYVEGLGHNLFSVGQFCDGDL